MAIQVQTNIDDGVWRKLVKRLSAEPDAHTRVGLLQAKGGSATNEDGIDMVTLGAIHEFGAGVWVTSGRSGGSVFEGVPERSFIRSTFQREEARLAQVQAKLAHLIVEEGMSMRRALGLLGIWGEAEVKKTISVGSHLAPLQPATIKAKGSSRPLVDTGQLVNAIAHDVKAR